MADINKGKKKRTRIKLVKTELAYTTNFGKNFMLQIYKGEGLPPITKKRKLIE